MDRPSLLLLLGSVCLTLFLAEVALRFWLHPSQYSSGRFLGREVPPFKLLPEESSRFEADRSGQIDGLIIDDVHLTVGDLWGIFQDDDVIGYVPKKDSVSANGWWQSNNFGARARRDTAVEKPAGVTRLLVFGESFAQGSRLRQEDSWPSSLGAVNPNLEVLNFAADGYSMAQAYLRYMSLRQELQHDLVVLMCVPQADLWRDVNIRRDMGEDWWGSVLSMPRFILHDDDIRLIRPYPSAKTLRRADFTPPLVASIKTNLRAHDRFYDEKVYEIPALLKHSLIYRLTLRSIHNHNREKYRDSLWNPKSEARRVSKRIFVSMSKEVETYGGKFHLIILPKSRLAGVFPPSTARFNRGPAQWDRSAGIRSRSHRSGSTVQAHRDRLRYSDKK
jgi:hypothetical protein